MIRDLNFRLSGPGSSLGQGHYVVFLSWKRYSHSASLHLGCRRIGHIRILGIGLEVKLAMKAGGVPVQYREYEYLKNYSAKSRGISSDT